MQRFVYTPFIAVSLLFAFACGASSTVNATDSWSLPTNGLQARIALVEKPKEFGTRWIVPYLELRNVRDATLPLNVRCGRRHIQFELIDAAGNALTNRAVMSRSGPVPDLGQITLPHDSLIRISMECRNWGVPAAAAMIATASGAWVLKDSDRGHVFLRAIIVGEWAGRPDVFTFWHGRLETPLVKVHWQ